jgi:hypothetical protein
MIRERLYSLSTQHSQVPLSEKHLTGRTQSGHGFQVFQITDRLNRHIMRSLVMTSVLFLANIVQGFYT